MRIVMDEAVEYGDRIIEFISPDVVYDFCVEKGVHNADREVFIVIGLNSRKEFLFADIDTVGVDNAALVSPKQIFRTAIKKSAGSIVVAHNHPSGKVVPSAEDIKVSRRLVEVGELIDIPVLDNVIIGRPRDGSECGFMSLRESGLLKFGD